MQCNSLLGLGFPCLCWWECTEGAPLGTSYRDRSEDFQRRNFPRVQRAARAATEPEPPDFVAEARRWRKYAAAAQSRRQSGGMRRGNFRLLLALPGVLGAIDGSLIDIISPPAPKYDEQAYCDRYGHKSLKLHMIAGPMKEAQFWSSGHSGRSSDSTTLNETSSLLR